MKRLISALLFAAFAVTAAGCTATRGNGSLPQGAAASRPAPAPDSFDPKCRDLAPHVIRAWNTAADLLQKSRTEVTPVERHDLETDQEALAAGMSKATPEVRKSVGVMVYAIGWLRFMGDTKNPLGDAPDLTVKAGTAVQNACNQH